MKYLVTMRNPKSGKLEAYKTEANNQTELQLGLDFWQDAAGYEIISCKEIRGGEFR